MSLVGRIPGQHEQVRHLQELTRRDETKLPSTDALEDWQDLAPYLGVGWFEESDWPRFYRDRARVYFAGVVTFNAATPGAQHRFPVASMPAGYLPSQAGPGTGFDPHLVLHTMFGYTSSATVHAFWELGIDPTGKFYLDYNPDFAAAPDLGYAPDDTAFMLDGVSYRAA